MVSSPTDSPTVPRVVAGGLLAATTLALLAAVGHGTVDAGTAVAVETGTRSVTAWLASAAEPTVWLMVLSARVFGVSVWALLLPQALLGAGAVLLVWGTAGRLVGEVPALVVAGVAGLAAVLVPVFRSPGPAALVVFLLALTVHLLVARAHRRGAYRAPARASR